MDVENGLPCELRRDRLQAVQSAEDDFDLDAGDDDPKRHNAGRLHAAGHHDVDQIGSAR